MLTTKKDTKRLTHERRRSHRHDDGRDRYDERDARGHECAEHHDKDDERDADADGLAAHQPLLGERVKHHLSRGVSHGARLEALRSRLLEGGEVVLDHHAVLIWGDLGGQEGRCFGGVRGGLCPGGRHVGDPVDGVERAHDGGDGRVECAAADGVFAGGHDDGLRGGPLGVGVLVRGHQIFGGVGLGGDLHRVFLGEGVAEPGGGVRGRSEREDPDGDREPRPGGRGAGEAPGQSLGIHVFLLASGTPRR
nr:hypothetical protein [Demequina litorisediminis]